MNRQTFTNTLQVLNPEMKYRLQRTTKVLRVLPSIKAVTNATLSYSSINAYLLNLEVFTVSSSQIKISDRKYTIKCNISNQANIDQKSRLEN